MRGRPTLYTLGSIRSTTTNFSHNIRFLLNSLPDLTTVTLNLSACSSRRSSSSGFIDEQVYVDLADVDLRAQPDIPRISRTCGRGALEHLAATSVTYPAHVQRAMRKHQLVLSMRTAVQKVLEGYEKTCELNFGPVDWRHDPKIFGLESSTAMCMEHALEASV